MSNKKEMHQILDSVPEADIPAVINCIREKLFCNDGSPNKELMESIQKSNDMFFSKAGQCFDGTAQDFINMFLEE